MPEFQYQGIDKAGKKVVGKMEVASEGELRVSLRGQGVRPIRISKVGALNADIGSLLRGSGGGSVKLEVLISFTRQLQVLVSSGIPLVQSLEMLLDQSSDRTMKIILSSVKEKVSSGTYFWESIAGYPKVFPKLYISLVRAGESSGSLDAILKRLTRYLEDADRIQKILKSAMMYPIIVLGIGAAVVFGLLYFVIPKFESMLTSAGEELPGPTQFVIDMSHFMVNNALFIVGGVSTVLYLGSRYLSTEEGRAVKDRIVFKLPLFGPLAQKGGVARFSRTMQTLLNSGVNLIDAIDICKATIDNSVLEAAVGKIRAEVESGKTLGSVVSKIDAFPRMAVQMISVGESTGNLDKMLEKVADFYEAEIEIMVSGMTKLIEPIILVFLGGTVGGVMIAMYLPIFKMAGSAGG